MAAARKTSASTVKTGLPESAVQVHVDLVCGWKHVPYYHTKDSRGSHRGFPDSVCIGPGGGLVIECKDDDGKTTPEQDMWLWLFESVGFRVLLVRPEDTRNRPEHGGKSLIQVEIEKIATGEGGVKFPPHIITALQKSRSEEVRRLAATIARGQARRRR